MKRLFSIAFVGIYFCLSVGVNVLIHTCCGYRTVDLMPTSAADPCGCTEEMSDEMCCTLVLKVFHLDDDQQTAYAGSLAAPDFSVVAYPQAAEIPVCETITPPVPVDTSPPFHISPSILNCSLLI
jgi:hypothetical protein